MFLRKETLKKTQDTLEGLGLSASSGMPWGPAGGDLSIWYELKEVTGAFETFTYTCQLWMKHWKMDPWMDDFGGFYTIGLLSTQLLFFSFYHYLL